MNGSPLPYCGGVDASPGCQTFRPDPQVVAGVGGATDDSPEVTGGFRSQANGIYQLEGATFCLERVRFMNVAVHEHRRSAVVSALAATGTFDGVVDRRCRTWS